METLANRPGKIDWKALLARCSSRGPGFFDQGALPRMIANREVVSGLVVSIGVLCEGAGPVPARILEFLQSLAGAREVGGRSGEDEFLLICRDERGAAAQRRLARISRELWDFQLGSLGDFAILFSWGGVEAEHEPIEEALALASMRMQETRRGREALMTKAWMTKSGMTGEVRAASAFPAARLS